MSEKDLIFFYAPQSRALGVRILLEELAAPHTLHVLNMKAGDLNQPDFLAVNPVGQVPTIQHHGTVITEQAAIYIYLADAFPSKNLAPKLSDPLRGSYLKWMVYYGSCLEPAVTDHALKREPAPAGMSPYGTYENVFSSLACQLEKGPFLLGEKFSAVDVLWGSALNWMLMWKIIPANPLFIDYAKRISERPASIKMRNLDNQLASEQKTQGT